MELNPVRGWGAPDKDQFVLRQMKKNPIPNHIAIVTARDELFGFVYGEIVEAVDSKIGEHFEGIGALNKYIHHVMRLVEKNAGLPPGELFITPVCELGWNHRIDVSAYLRISQHVHRVSNGL
jgi:hypothetical protein